MPQVLAEGSHIHFKHTMTTSASKEQIWSLWTRPETWGSWDGGLKSAQVDGVFKQGARGQLIDVSGRSSSFTITVVELLRNYAFEVKLPLARLTVRRFFEASGNGETIFTHDVRFSGLSAWIFAQIYGPGFRAELPHTMQRLAEFAEARTNITNHPL